MNNKHLKLEHSAENYLTPTYNLTPSMQTHSTIASDEDALLEAVENWDREEKMKLKLEREVKVLSKRIQEIEGRKGNMSFVLMFLMVWIVGLVFGIAMQKNFHMI